MSQQTQDYSSSFYGDNIDPLLAPDILISQQTAPTSRSLGSDQISTRPHSCPEIIKDWVLYTEMNKDEFVEWWLTTSIRSDLYEKSHQFFDVKKRHSDGWRSFHQVAHTRTGDPRILCKECGQLLDHPSRKGNGTTPMTRHLKGAKCQKLASHASKTSNLKELFELQGQLYPPSQRSLSIEFNEKAFMEDLTDFVAGLRLPYVIVENPLFQKLLQRAQASPRPLQFPSARTVHRQIHQIGQGKQQSILNSLPERAKLSIALDCWTSPFSQAFMAITGYFIDINWNYREFLLGFEPLEGTHSGENLSSVLLTRLKDYDITHRILAITSDNASNNQTLVDSLNDEIETLAEAISAPILEPSNEYTEREFRPGLTSGKKDILSTFNKVRAFAVFVNASPQLLPIQDVKTRWNSTFLLLRRAKRIRSTYQTFCTESGYNQFFLDREEWRQIDYLLCITRPFYNFTTVLCQTKDVTIHNVFQIYNALFEHFEKSLNQLRRKKVSWKQAMRQALEAGKRKLAVYYGKTTNAHGHLYAIGTILAPSHKLNYFSGDEWSENEYEWRATYRDSFYDYIRPY
ncbi:hypothetical protein N7499_003392 [Penicillium canescens]|nr:hypothetical protein N7499_003392 [Penicillium canescens]